MCQAWSEYEFIKIRCKSVVNPLAIPAALPVKSLEHDLKGNYKGFKECHIAPNWLLIYRYNGEYLELSRTGTDRKSTRLNSSHE